MIKIGITGPMGSGKSYCSKLFEDTGIKVFYTDIVAKEVIKNNTSLRKEIISEFGDVYDSNGIIPHKLRNIVFVEGGEQKLEMLNNIVHPYVYKEYDKFCSKYKNKKYTIAESALLFEKNMINLVDRVIYVYADVETRIDRAFKRSGISENEYNIRMKDQIDEAYKLEKSDFIIYNNDSNDVIEQVNRINYLLNSVSF